MAPIEAAFYARVSGERQADAQTIQSQIAALRERVASDEVSVPPDREFVDDGYTGATLVRPALERLRDLASAGAIQRIYVHSPDRLARSYAYQVVLLDEWRRYGIEVVFLNKAIGKSPEDDLLLQVQGVVAEYERAKIMERCRRGKRHAARTGNVSVMSCAPYGYRYINSQGGGGVARFEPILEQARVVRQIFTWVGRDRLSLNQVARRLREAGEPTATGKQWWSRTIVWHILQNPAYKGQAAYGKTRARSIVANARGRSAGVPSIRDTIIPPPRWNIRIGYRYQCRRWSMNLYSMRLKNNSARIARGRAKAGATLVISCKAWPAAAPADMLITPRGCGNEALADSSSIMFTTAAPALMAIDSAVGGYAQTHRSEAICLSRPSGLRCAPSLKTREDLRRNTVGAWPRPKLTPIWTC